MKNAIFLTFDDKFSLYARACLNSMARNYSEHPELLVFFQGRDPEMLEYLRSFKRLTLIPRLNLEPLDSGWHLGYARSGIVYHRYCLWTELFNGYDNVLQLDVDTLVLKPLDELFAHTEFFAVPNHCHIPHVRVFSPGAINDGALLSMLKEDGLPAFDGPDDMCNAGVYLMPKHYRTPEQCELLMHITRKYNRFFLFADQSALSVWCKLNAIEYSRSYEYNFQVNHFGTMHYDLDDIAILHYSSNFKPDTMDFMLRRDITVDRRRQLAQLFFSYLDEPALRL